MKSIYTTTAVLLFFVTLSFGQSQFQFETEEHDFGTVQEADDTIRYDFTFKNVGIAPLIISDVTTACECTIAEWPKQPIMPGKTGIIKSGFYISGKSGVFKKGITITANSSPAITTLWLKGNVEKSD